MDETVKHVAKGFLGLSLNCATCHDRKYDPLRQEDEYAMRAFFEPLHARLDVLPGEPDLERDGILRVFDSVPDVATFLFVCGEDTQPDTSRPILPGVAAVFDCAPIMVRPVSLPKTQSQPARRPRRGVLMRAAWDTVRAKRVLVAARAMAGLLNAAAKLAAAAAEALPAAEKSVADARHRVARSMARPPALPG